MKRFLVIAEQGGGCDYTIGCGVKTWMEDAESMEELKETITRALLAGSEYEDDDYNEDYSGRLSSSEYSYDRLTIYEISESHAFDLKALKKELNEKSKAKAEAAKLAKEKAEYKRLKNKFGN